MYVSVSLWFSIGQPGLDFRQHFWKSFLMQRENQPVAPPDLPSSHLTSLEEEFKAGFPRHLQRHLNEEMSQAVASRPEIKLRIPRPMTVRLVAIQYGSLKAILDIVGLDDGDLRELALTALSIYAPVAFNEALHTNVTLLHASAEQLGGELAANSSTTAATRSDVQGGVLPVRTNDAVARIWTITNLTLIVPVLLALVVVYFAYSGLMHELDGLRIEAAALQQQRTSILETLLSKSLPVSKSTDSAGFGGNEQMCQLRCFNSQTGR